MPFFFKCLGGKGGGGGGKWGTLYQVFGSKLVHHYNPMHYVH